MSGLQGPRPGALARQEGIRRPSSALRVGPVPEASVPRGSASDLRRRSVHWDMASGRHGCLGRTVGLRAALAPAFGGGGRCRCGTGGGGARSRRGGDGVRPGPRIPSRLRVTGGRTWPVLVGAAKRLPCGHSLRHFVARGGGPCRGRGQSGPAVRIRPPGGEGATAYVRGRSLLDTAYCAEPSHHFRTYTVTGWTPKFETCCGLPLMKMSIRLPLMTPPVSRAHPNSPPCGRDGDLYPAT